MRVKEHRGCITGRRKAGLALLRILWIVKKETCDVSSPFFALDSGKVLPHACRTLAKRFVFLVSAHEANRASGVDIYDCSCFKETMKTAYDFTSTKRFFFFFFFNGGINEKPLKFKANCI